MSEKLTNEVELNNYLKTLDLNNRDVKRVLSALQMLHPKFLESMLNLLVIGKINIVDLYDKEINNKSAPLILSAALASGSETLLNHIEHYRRNIKSRPSYTSFINTKRIEANKTLSRSLIPANTFYVHYLIDEMRYVPNSYIDNSSIMKKYDLVVFSPAVQNKFAQLSTLSNALKNTYGITDMPKFNTDLTEQIFSYRFLKPDDGSIYYNLNSDTLVGWILRDMYLDIPYMNLVENMNYIFNEMGKDYATDAARLGVPTINRLITNPNYSYKTVFSSGSVDREETFLNELSRAVNLHYTFYTKLYGTAYFNVTTEIAVFEKIIEYFNMVKQMCMVIINEMKDYVRVEV